MSTVKVNNVQIGQSATAAQNFTLTAATADGTMKLARGLPGATTQDIMSVSAGGVVDVPVPITVVGAPTERIQTSALVLTTSGTAFDIIVPTWAKKITFALDRVSLTGSDFVVYLLSTGGIFLTTGYAGGMMNGGTAGVVGTNAPTSYHNVAADARSGITTFMSITGTNTWAMSSLMGSPSNVGLCGCSIPLTGALDKIRMQASGANTFDGGAFSVLFEG